MKTRFSPSPTGSMHLGNVRTALFSYLLGHHGNGTFLLRIEDTDKVRSKDEFTELVKEDLMWLGLNWDEGPFFQSQRQEIYKEYYQYLEDHQAVYPCFCSDEQLALARKVQISSGQPPRYSGTCKNLTHDQINEKISQGIKPTLRFKVPLGKDIQFHDLVKGPQRFRSDDIGDFIIRRADGSASFFFCNAIDDSLMGVTHSIRGEDHLTNTPRQILILSALNLTIPQYGHISLILDTQGGPLSKRDQSRSLAGMRAHGYLPIAINNYLGRLGHYYEQTHLMTQKELIQHFDITRVGKTPAHFDEAQLLHWQKSSVLQLDNDAFWNWISEDTQKLIPHDKQKLFIDLIKPNILFTHEAYEWAVILFSTQAYSHESITLEFLKTLHDIIQTEGNNYPVITKVLSEKLQIKGKALFQPLRMVLTGLSHGPELQGIFTLLGKEGLLEKIQAAINT